MKYWEDGTSETALDLDDHPAEKQGFPFRADAPSWHKNYMY